VGAVGYGKVRSKNAARATAIGEKHGGRSHICKDAAKKRKDRDLSKLTQLPSLYSPFVERGSVGVGHNGLRLRLRSRGGEEVGIRT